MTKKSKSKKKTTVGTVQADQANHQRPPVQLPVQLTQEKITPISQKQEVANDKIQKPVETKEVQTVKPKVPEVSIIPIGQNSTPGLTPEAAASGKKKKKRNKKKAGQQQTGDSSEASPAVTVIPLNKDPGTIPAHLNPAVVLARQTESSGPKVIEASPVVTLIGSNKKAQGHGALYNPPPVPQVPQAPKEEIVPEDKRQTISGGFKFPSSLQPVFETPESIAVSTGVVLDSETSGVLTIVPIRPEGAKKRRNRNKVLPPCCELKGTSGLEVVCPHSNKPILNYNTIVNEDREKSRQFQETQESLQQIEDPEVLGSLANIGHSVTIKLIGGGGTEKTVHSCATGPEVESKTFLIDAADAMSNEKAEKTAPVANGIKPDETEKARLKAERRAAFEAKRLAEMGSAGKENKKELTKAERRAIQEAQRAKKAQEKNGPVAEKPTAVKDSPLTCTKSNSESPPKQEGSSSDRKKDMPTKKVSFADMKFAANPFVNMHKRRDNIDNLLRSTERRKKDDGDRRNLTHPAILQLGFQIADGAVSGANDRCVYMLEALKKVAHEFGSNESSGVRTAQELSQEFISRMDFNVAFLRECRPLSVSMTNAINYIKNFLSEQDSIKDASQLADTIVNTINGFLQNEITLARRAIVEIAKSKINDGDVVLTYARSSVVLDILTTCHKEGKRFSVVVVDSRPALKGRETLKALCQRGIHCKYIFIHSVSYIMKEVTKVLLSADTLLANGYVASRVGSAQISMIAHKMNVPVLVCCETYKFSDKVLADCFAGNELGSQKEFLQNLSEKRKQLLCTTLSSTVSLVDLTYDITPPEFVTMVVTERGALPCTSVPVVLRVRQNII